jgi:Rad52/22 family double-strand break repair protein
LNVTQHPDLFTALAAPFAAGEVKSRNQAGRALRYVTARTVMNRLDEVLGPECWSDAYVPLDHGVLCTLTIRLPDGQVVTKSDAGGEAGMTDEGDNEKSAFSDAFKRAAVRFGVGRYLYGDGVAQLGVPAAVPQIAATIPARAGSEDAQGRGGASVYGQAGVANGQATSKRPRTGEDLQHYAAGCRVDPCLKGWIVGTFRKQGYPAKIVDWTESQVTAAWPTIREHLIDVGAATKKTA